MRRKKWKRKNKYISAYKGKDEWLETLEYEEALKERKNESEQMTMIQVKGYKRKR